jgi:hypothetical protein
MRRHRRARRCLHRLHPPGRHRGGSFAAHGGAAEEEGLAAAVAGGVCGGGVIKSAVAPR